MLFKLGLFLIPFENFFFAFSRGWGTIAPLIFVVYILKNFKYWKKLLKIEKKFIKIVFFILSWGIIITGLFQKVNYLAILRTAITLGLGIIFYFSLVLRYKIKQHNLNNDIQIMLYGYLISIFFGIFQWIVYKFNNQMMINIIVFLSKRAYLDRIQYTFTEPSFISIHLYGIILILYFILKKNQVKPTKFHKSIMLIFVVLTLVIGQSARFILDSLVVGIIIITYYFFKSNIHKLLKIVLIFCFISLSCLIYMQQEFIMENIKKNYPRIEKIYRQGIYADASLASRYFRINASIKGYKKNIFRLLTGNGVGNIGVPLALGYDEARKEYTNSYLTEVEELKEFNGYSLFSMHIKIISEYGIVIFSLLLMKLYSRKYILEYCIILYLLIQFDSYVIYFLWIYIFIINHQKVNFKGENNEK